MKKRLLKCILILFVLLLAACSGAAGPTGVEAPIPGDSPTPSATALQALSTDTPQAPINSLISECTLVSSLPADQAQFNELFAPTEEDWVTGPEDAAVTIVEYGDFQCPYCAQLAPLLEEIKTKYPQDVRVVYRHFPLDSLHDKALLATQAAEAAGLQDKFWEMHDLLYTNAANWVELSPEEFTQWLLDMAPELELDIAQFEADLSSDELVALAQSAWEYGQEIGITYTPFVVINDNIYNGPLSVAGIADIIELNILTDRQYTQCPPMLIDPLEAYNATIETEKGDIVLELFPDVAPLAVNSFIFLAREGWFDGITFHRVIPGFVAQAGDPSGTGFGGPGYAFKNEVTPDLVFDRAGLLAMANTGEDTNGSQFFITYGPAERLNGNFTIFGQVKSGSGVLQDLTPRDPSQAMGLPPGDEIIRITIHEQ